MIYAIDIETYEHKPFDCWRPVLNARCFALGCIINERGVRKFFTSPNEMAGHILDLFEQAEKSKKNCYIYGHNIEFDFYGIFQNHLKDSKIRIMKTSPFLAAYGERGLFIDTMFFFPCSLKKVGQEIGLEKGEMPLEINDLVELKPYLSRDCEITIKAVLTIKEKLDKYGFSIRRIITPGQVAMSSFMTYLKKNKLEKGLMEGWGKSLKIISLKNRDIVRRAYRGGRTESFQKGIFENVKGYDINSLYPYALSNMECPDLSTEKYINQITIDMLPFYMKYAIGVVHCKIKCPKNIKYGYLPIRYTSGEDKYLLFPKNKVLIGTWTLLEIKKALELGYEIVELYDAILFKKLEINPFKGYMDMLYANRIKEESKEDKIVIKMLMNNLIGKFGQYKEIKERRIVTRYDSKAYLESGWEVISSIDDSYVIEKVIGKDKEYKRSNAMISAQCTAFARDYHYKYLSKIPTELMYYCDTDSLFCDKSCENLFPITNLMGHFKITNEGKMELIGEKKYAFNEEIKLSGLPSKHRTIEVLRGNESPEVERMIGISKAIALGDETLAGTFTKERFIIKQKNKDDLFLPNEINENLFKRW